MRDKIKKLHALAEGGSPNEKDVAATKRDQLLQKYGVTLAEVLQKPKPQAKADPWEFFRAKASETVFNYETDSTADDLMARMREELEERSRQAYAKQQQRERDRRQRSYVRQMLESKYKEMFDQVKANSLSIAQQLDKLLDTQDVIARGLKKLEEALEQDLDPAAMRRVVSALVKTQHEQLRVNNELLVLALVQRMRAAHFDER